MSTVTHINPWEATAVISTQCTACRETRARPVTVDGTYECCGYTWALPPNDERRRHMPRFRGLNADQTEAIRRETTARIGALIERASSLTPGSAAAARAIARAYAKHLENPPAVLDGALAHQARFEHALMVQESWALIGADDDSRRKVSDPRWQSRAIGDAVDRAIAAGEKSICVAAQPNAGKTLAIAAALWVRVEQHFERWGASSGARWWHATDLAGLPWYPQTDEQSRRIADVKRQLRGEERKPGEGACALLIVDDLGAEAAASEAHPWPSMLHRLLDVRRGAGLETWVTTQLGEDALRRRYGDGIIRRLAGPRGWIAERGKAAA